jgi:hypothetical protein
LLVIDSLVDEEKKERRSLGLPDLLPAGCCRQPIDGSTQIHGRYRPRGSRCPGQTSRPT